MCTNKYYSILVSEYSKKHFIKSFEKKYKWVWLKTFETIENMLCRIDTFLLSTKAEKIHVCDTWYIAKCKFKIVWSHESAKTWGNRIIVFVDEEKEKCEILLIYAKPNYWGHNETTWWEQEIKNNHKEIYDLFKY